MTLFALGFILTIRALPTGTDMLGSSSGESGLSDSAPSLLLVGFIASLAGLGLATVGPAVLFVMARRTES